MQKETRTPAVSFWNQPGIGSLRNQERGGESMRGKLRDKREVKRDRLKREIIGRKPSKRDNRNLQLLQQPVDDDYPLDAEDELTIEEKQRN
jgi:hypothetical protein